MQLLEGVLHHVLGGGQVTDHQHGQPDQLQLVRLEQLGHLLRGFRGHLGHGATVVPARPRARTADDIRRIGFHTLETRSRPGALRGDTNTTTVNDSAGTDYPVRASRLPAALPFSRGY